MALDPELDLLVTFALILIAAEIGSIVFRWLRLPRVVGMLVAGLMIGPSVNPWAETVGINPDRVSDLAFLGGIFLMFSIGLSLNVRQLGAQGARGLVLGTVAGVLSFGAGYAVAIAFGQSNEVALLIGLILTPTSSTIAIRLTQEQNLLSTRGIGTTISGIVLDDVITLFVATIVLAVIGTGMQSVDWGGLVLGLFLVMLLAVIFVALAFQTFPTALRVGERLSGGNPALLAIALAFLVALAFTLIGLPPIFGAFWAGAVIGTSDQGTRVKGFTAPVTEVFAAVFFTAIGMLINPGAFTALGWLALALVVVAVAAKFLGGFACLRLFQTPTGAALMCATVLIPRGEISLVIAQFAGDEVVQAELQFLAGVLMIVTALASPLLLMGVRGGLRRNARRLSAKS